MEGIDRSAVLIVEDDALLRDAFRLLLEDSGYRVLGAGTADEAVDLARREHPGLVLLDLGLPDRSGMDVVRELRQLKELNTISVVALSGRPGREERQRCLQAGFSEYLEKPVRPRWLLQELPRLLGLDAG
ncbi:MAG: response regulator [Gemmatimonadota bacterium]|jgi:DNA-binding response OmpR family regulator